jgi:biopolymer transport protein ExbB/TolQ
MGTLIPLGPALSGLSSGDMASLAANLVVAFTATVVGLLISGVAYGVGLARRTWYSRDLTDLEFVAQRLAGVDVAA